MSKKLFSRGTTISCSLGLILAVGCVSAFSSDSEDSTSKVNIAPAPYTLDESGDLIRPVDYRTWVYVGTPVTPNDMNNGKAAFPEHHNVYIHPDNYQHYLSTGEWSEGTILVKELVSVGSKQAVSGNGYFQGEFIGLEATIKSRKDFPDEPGNWAYFSFTNTTKLGGDLALTASAFPTASCNACHAASADDDFVFTQHYPVLRSAKNAKRTPENQSSRPKTLGALAIPMNDDITFDQSARDAAWQATQPTPSSVAGTDVPTGQDDLFAYLKSKAYQSWKNQESEMHPSRGPHTNYGKPVKAFMNDTLSESMIAGNKEHPIGSTAIKEMYTSNYDLEGWAVEIKTHESSDSGNGWFWYEVTSVTDGNSPVAIGNGVQGCYECHSAGGTDFVKTTWPLN
ncbi:MAG: cytochrome P460 family protein [Phycisphaerales bacterium]|jgi:hypothetical protein|nr:cytochrome P460 family protein [Phycisphaerales bacterium]